MTTEIKTRYFSMKLIKSIATVGGFTALSRIFGFIRDIAIASFLGAGPVADAFFVAFKIPNLFRRLFAEGAFNAAFVPTFANALETKGHQEAAHVAEQIFSTLFFILLALTIVVEMNMDWLMRIIVPGFTKTPERITLVIEFTRITFPYLLFVSLCALLGGVLNSLHRFAAAAATPVLLNIFMILGLVLFAQWMETPGHALAWAVALAGVAQFVWLYVSVLQIDIKIKVRIPKLTPTVRKLFRLMAPGAIGAGVTQINLFVDVIIASLLPTGAVSYLFYADRLNQLPLSLSGIAISTVLLPLMARQLKTNQAHDALNSQNRALEFGLFLVLPATVALIVLAHPLISILFERGAFGAYQTQQTAYVLVAFACGLPAYVLVKVFSTSLFARENTKIPVLIASISVGLNCALNLLLMEPFKHVGIAAATALSSWANAGMLFYYLHQKSHLILDQRLHTFLPRAIFASFVMGCILTILEIGLSSWLYTQSVRAVVALLILIFTGFCVFLVLSVLLKAIHVEELKEAFRRTQRIQA